MEVKDDEMKMRKEEDGMEGCEGNDDQGTQR